MRKFLLPLAVLLLVNHAPLAPAKAPSSSPRPVSYEDGPDDREEDSTIVPAVLDVDQDDVTDSSGARRPADPLLI